MNMKTKIGRDKELNKIIKKYEKDESEDTPFFLIFYSKNN